VSSQAIKHPKRLASRHGRDVVGQRGQAPWPDALVAEIASCQHGLVTRRQLLARDISPAVIGAAVERGRLIPRHRGVYAVGHRALPPLATPHAAVLAVGVGAYASHASALTIHGLVRWWPPPAEPHVTVVGREGGRRRPGIRLHRTVSLDRRDVTIVDGVPVIAPARSMLDIAPDLSDADLERAFDEALKERILTAEQLRAMLERHPGRPGATRLGRLADGDSRAVGADLRSDGERRLRALIRSARLPVPTMNARLGPYRVDALWPDAKLIVEIDGYWFHSTRRSFRGDHERDLELRAAGYEILRFTYEQVRDEPALVLVRITERLIAAQIPLTTLGSALGDGPRAR
jgi:very-short-patch-repair endonuclease